MPLLRSQVQQVEGREEVEILRHEWSQSLAGRSHYQSLRQDLDYFNVHGRDLETEWLACQNAVRVLEAQVAQILQL